MTPLTDDGTPNAEPTVVARAGLAAIVARLEANHPRWVWDDTTTWYPGLLAAGVRVERCVDLRLSHAILRHSELTASSALATAAQSSWDSAVVDVVAPRAGVTLFDFAADAPDVPEADPLCEFRMQREAIASAPDPNRIGLLLAAESAGATSR